MFSLHLQRLGLIPVLYQTANLSVVLNKTPVSLLCFQSSLCSSCSSSRSIKSSPAHSFHLLFSAFCFILPCVVESGSCSCLAPGLRRALWHRVWNCSSCDSHLGVSSALLSSLPSGDIPVPEHWAPWGFHSDVHCGLSFRKQLWQDCFVGNPGNPVWALWKGSTCNVQHWKPEGKSSVEP